MSKHPPIDPHELPLALAAELDRVCDHFAAEWMAGRPPRAEDYLGCVADTLRSALLEELLRVELEARRSAGETPTPDEFRERFPGDTAAIDAAFQPMTATDLDRRDSSNEQSDAKQSAGTSYRTVPDEAIESQPVPTGWRADLHDRPLIKGYDVLQRLGGGGMGVVYKARHRGLNRLVALKMIRSDKLARADYMTRLRAEAEAVARLQHPNIVQVYDIGESEGLPFVELELLDGGRLADRLAGTPQPGQQASELIITLARAVQVAHDAGIVHRDLKPANVLYTADGLPKIADFGLAKRIDSDAGHTESGQIMGSPSYMAPEQARGHSRSVGPPADVYALGAILYEMLTGRPPFKGETPIETIRQVIDDDPLPPSRLVPRVPRDLETICLKCLRKDPDRRYESAQAMADDLKRFLKGEPIKARPIPLRERGAKWARRRPFAATIVALGMAGFLGSIAGVFVHQRNSFLQALQREQDGSRLLDEAMRAQDQPSLARAEANLANMLATVLPGTGLDELRSRLEAGLNRARRRIEQIRAQEAGLSRQRADQDKFRNFRERFTEALFHDTQFTGLDLPTNQAATRRAAEEALNCYAASGPSQSWALGSLPSTLDSAQQHEIADDCYDLLLVLAAAEPSPREGLRWLDRAARLRPATRAYHLRRAACLARTGDAPSAERERAQAERLRPTSAFDHFLAGQERYKSGDPMQAIRHFNNALRLQPDHFWAQCLSAICWLQLTQPVQAAASLTACLKREPEFAWLYILRGFASSLVPVGSRPEEIKLRSEAAEADYRWAMDLLERRPNGELHYVVLVNRGLLRLQRNDLENGTSDLRAAIRLNDRPSQAYAALAEFYLEEHKLDEAVEQFTQAIKRRPDWAPLYRARADVDLSRSELTREQCARALRDLAQAILLEKSDNKVLARDYTNRGRLLFRDHREAEALAACDAALKVVPNYPEALHLRIDVLFAAGRNDEVIRSCDALIAGGKLSAQLTELRGLARAASKDYAGAAEDAGLALVLAPDKTTLLARRGWLYILTDAPRLALRDFEETLKRDPSSGEAYTGRGAARVRLGQLRDGVADAEKALDLGPQTSRLLYNVARIYAEAAIAATNEVRKRVQDSVVVAARYENRAVVLAREALKHVPADQRATFWRDSIQADPSLNRLRRRIAAPDLAGPVTPAATRPEGGARSDPIH
jgi:tetratricopeptide (TPR) repeat protein/tRNA A-37 threonylcarbamoyl transferase component Bud32